MRSAGWVCAQFILEFSHSPVFMDRTDTVYLYVCIQYFVGAWLALRMPPRPPPSLFSKPSGAESQVFKTESVPELFIYLFIYRNALLTRVSAYYIYIYLYLSIYIYMCVCVYVWMQVSYT